MSKCPSSLQSFHFLIFSVMYHLDSDFIKSLWFESRLERNNDILRPTVVLEWHRESSRRPRLEYKGPLFSWSVWVCWSLRMRLILLVLVLFLASPLFLCQHLTPQERKILETEYFLQKLMEELSVQPKMIIAKANKGMRRLVHFH